MKERKVDSISAAMQLCEEENILRNKVVEAARKWAALQLHFKRKEAVALIAAVKKLEKFERETE